MRQILAQALTTRARDGAWTMSSPVQRSDRWNGMVVVVRGGGGSGGWGVLLPQLSPVMWGGGLQPRGLLDRRRDCDIELQRPTGGRAQARVNVDLLDAVVALASALGEEHGWSCRARVEIGHALGWGCHLTERPGMTCSRP